LIAEPQRRITETEGRSNAKKQAKAKTKKEIKKIKLRQQQRTMEQSLKVKRNAGRG